MDHKEEAQDLALFLGLRKRKARTASNAAPIRI